MPQRRARPRHSERRLRDALRHDFTLVTLGLFAVGCFAVAFVGTRSSGHSRTAAPAADSHLSSAMSEPLVDGAGLAVDEPGSGEAPPETPASPSPPSLHVTRGVIPTGGSLFSSLREQGVPPAVIYLIAQKMAGHFNFRLARPGHSYELVQEEDGRVSSFRYQTSTVESYRLFFDGDGYQVRREEAELIPRTVRVAGLVTSSLYVAIRDLGESPELASDLADVFAWDIDFSRSVQPGDEFRVLYERLYRRAEDGTEVYVRPGRILAARYQGAVGRYEAVYFESGEGRGGYYRPDGSSVERQFLRAPLRFSRVSSRFSSARRHPILKVTRPHHGIDYAAAHGTPIWSVADGKVSYRAWAGGFGNLVKVRHDNGYVSYYAHLSRFAKGLRVGDAVRQKQVIGYVGQTGLATGPHVCFRIAKDGRYVDPARLGTAAGDPLSPDLQDDFRVARDTLLGELDAGVMVAAEDAP